MFHWLASDDEQSRRVDGPRVLFRFAVEQRAEAVRVEVVLNATPPVADPPVLSAASRTGCRLERPRPGSGPPFVYELVLDPPADPHAEDEVVVDLEGAAGTEVPQCRIVVRRSACALQTGLIEHNPETAPLSAQTRAALLWRGWGRYAELVAVKRFYTGRSGNDVWVFRPRLREPKAEPRDTVGSSPRGPLRHAWGTWLLVKAGLACDVRVEWDRSQTYLADRLHPFLARCEAYLPIRPVGSAGAADRATLISSFLGGESLRTESLEQVLRGPGELDHGLRLLERVISTLAPWYAATETCRLGEWKRAYRGDGDDWLLFGHFDLTRATRSGERRGRAEYSAGVCWDTAFISADHLHGHLLGHHRDGLLYRLRDQIVARFSLTHGDLNSRNVLCDGNNVWLIDFEHVGVAPTVADFAWLEANLRLWCLTLTPSHDNLEDAALALEEHLLDHFHGTEGGLHAVHEWAAGLGTDPAHLIKIAHCIAHIRRLALPHCVPGSPDRRDYLAVLYLVVLSMLRYAGSDSAPPANFRWLVSLAWVLERVLCRLVGMKAFDRKRAPLNPRFLVARDWLNEPGAPGRVKYLMEHPDGRRALDHLAATHGVQQSLQHHLDVFDHSLLVVAYLEALLEAPLDGFLDPAEIDRRVEHDLRWQGIMFPAIPAEASNPAKPNLEWISPHLEAIRSLVASALSTDSAPLLLKWSGLLHDVGKPGTRALNPTARGWKVRFLGHEVYGLDLLGPLLDHLFAEECPKHGPMQPEKDVWWCGACSHRRTREPNEPRTRVATLIRRHHDHHQILQRFSEPARFEVLKAILHDCRQEVPELDYTAPRTADEFAFLSKYLEPDAGHAIDMLALLLLHGYADRLACRGPHSTMPMSQVAEINLTVLAVLTAWPRLELYRTWEEHFQKMIGGMVPELKVPGPRFGQVRPRLRTWYMREMAARKSGNGHELTRAELLEIARRLL